MSPRHGILLTVILVSVALCLADRPVRADRLHLRGGGIVEVGSWWVEDDQLMYEGAAGTVGLPRSMVQKIERTHSGETTLPKTEPTPRTKPQPEPTAEGTVRVPVETARRLNAAMEALENGDYQAAADGFASVLATSEVEIIGATVAYAVSLIALGQDAMALSVVLDGLARNPQEPRFLELLGDLRNREERVDEALRAWRDAFERSPSDRLREKIFKAERELHAGRDYALTASSHFNVRYDGEVDPPLSRAVVSFLEKEFWRLAGDFDHAPRRPITVVLYPSREFREVTLAPETVGGLYDGKIRVPLGGLKRLDPVAKSLLTHELTHAVVHSKTHGHCPRWLHEGLAQWSEGRRISRSDASKISQQLEGGDPAAWEQRGFSYPIALSLTRYLESRRGFTVLVDLLERIGEGENLDTALENLYGDTYPGLCRRWAREFLDGEHR